MSLVIYQGIPGTDTIEEEKSIGNDYNKKNKKFLSDNEVYKLIRECITNNKNTKKMKKEFIESIIGEITREYTKTEQIEGDWNDTIVYYSLNDHFQKAIIYLNKILDSKYPNEFNWNCRYDKDKTTMQRYHKGKHINDDIYGYMVYMMPHPVGSPEPYKGIEDLPEAKDESILDKVVRLIMLIWRSNDIIYKGRPNNIIYEQFQ